MDTNHDIDISVFVCKAELETPGAASEQAGSSDQED